MLEGRNLNKEEIEGRGEEKKILGKRRREAEGMEAVLGKQEGMTEVVLLQLHFMILTQVKQGKKDEMTEKIETMKNGKGEQQQQHCNLRL